MLLRNWRIKWCSLLTPILKSLYSLSLFVGEEFLSTCNTCFKGIDFCGQSSVVMAKQMLQHSYALDQISLQQEHQWNAGGMALQYSWFMLPRQELCN
ncbi:hypothetical protein C8J56DRAFT_983719 [Mycena floridula]|nr:hypothetical protein C8J56DRAFT_983719 [Mycena floridula]